MGLLSVGTPLPWEKAKEHADHVRKNGILQFLNIYKNVRSRQKDCLLWGDEIEYMLVSFDHSRKLATLALRGAQLLDELQKKELASESAGIPFPSSWKPEYGRYMLEATPGRPYGSSVKDLLTVEANMRQRRKFAEDHLQPNEFLVTATSFPRLGAGEFLHPHAEPRGQASHSMFIPDEAIAPHARFPTLTANIRKRRGRKVAINMPIFIDTKTPRPFKEKFSDPPFPEDGPQDALPDHIYMDAMCFGMGCSCLQLTFQACSIEEARYLYDHLAVVGPIMLALSAAAPIFRGYLANVDCRWDVIAGSVDDRTKEEMGLEPLKTSRRVINKSRYDSIDSYLSTDESFKAKYNDLRLVVDEEILATLKAAEIDELLAQHVAHLFIRDPLVIYAELLDQDPENSSDHFENIQSTNWQTMRFKPPPQKSTIGWRVEFRSMEIQLTEFENAAFAIFIVLLTRTILSFGLNFYIPISKCDVNMRKSHQRGAFTAEKFFFRKHVFNVRSNPLNPTQEQSSASRTTNSTPFAQQSLNFLRNRASSNGSDQSTFSSLSDLMGDPDSGEDPDAFEEMSLDAIINGSRAVTNDSGSTTSKSSKEFPGLIPLINLYLDSINVDLVSRCTIQRYFKLISKRASGEYVTAATWIRSFVRSHPAYKFDSEVSPEINYDLFIAIQKNYSWSVETN